MSSNLKNFFLEHQNQHFFQFPGGAGGEFISTLIADYCDRYTPIETEPDLYNRTVAIIPRLYRVVASMRGADLNTVDSFIDQFLHENNIMYNYDIDDIIQEARKWNTNNVRLIRIHKNRCELFTPENTFSFFPDDIYWQDYCINLKNIKLFGSEYSSLDKFCRIVIRERIEYLKRHGYEIHPAHDQAVAWLEQNKPKRVLFGHSKLLHFYDSIGSFERLFSMEIQELIDLLRSLPAGNDNPLKGMRPGFGQTKMNHTLLPMSECFESGLLEKTFNIDNTEFTKKLAQWHSDNLTVLNKFGF